jgi:hypothetical protein
MSLFHLAALNTNDVSDSIAKSLLLSNHTFHVAETAVVKVNSSTAVPDCQEFFQERTQRGHAFQMDRKMAVLRGQQRTTADNSGQQRTTDKPKYGSPSLT